MILTERLASELKGQHGILHLTTPELAEEVQRMPFSFPIIDLTKTFDMVKRQLLLKGSLKDWLTTA